MTKEVIYEEGKESLPYDDFVANVFTDSQVERVIVERKQGQNILDMSVYVRTKRGYVLELQEEISEETDEQPVQED